MDSFLLADARSVVAQAKAGDPAGFEALYRAFESPVYNLSRRICRTAEDAEDVLQETFLKAYEHLADFQGNSKFYTWLVRIAVNQSLMKLRKRKSDASVSLDDPYDTGEETVTREIAVWDPNPELTYSREEIREILERAIESLPPTFRAVFALRDIEGLSTDETATMLNLSVPAVKSRLLRARLRLREKLTRVFKRKGDDFFGYV
jgi:RNA polymerase sigma-70 factor (ECF subfamily)